MSEPVTKHPRYTGQEGSESGEGRELEPTRHVGQKTKKIERRWEFGVFVRKIVNGRIVKYLEFPPRGRLLVQRQEKPSDPHGADVPEQPQPIALTADTGAGGSGGGTDQPAIGDPEPAGDPGTDDDWGPIDTRYEAGLFLRSVTESSDDS